MLLYLWGLVIGVFGYGAYDSLHGHYTDKEGKNAVEKCVTNKKNCSLSEYKVVAEFSTKQDEDGSLMLSGLVLSMVSSSLLSGVIVGSGVANRRRKPKKTKRNNNAPKN